MSSATAAAASSFASARGIFRCRSLLGQVVAALVAGNAVAAKPAEQTPMVAAEAVRTLHEAGVPKAVLQFVPGDGKVGAALVRIGASPASPSPARPRSRARSTAAGGKDGPIVPLIAETGGINPMIVDATALPEQVDRRCHRLGVSISGAALLRAAAPMRPGGCCRPHDRDDCRRGAGIDRRPWRAATHVGPVIDAEAKAAARPMDRCDGCPGPGPVSLGRSSSRCRPAGFRAAHHHCTRPRARSDRGGVRAGPARRALARGRTRCAAR